MSQPGGRERGLHSFPPTCQHCSDSSGPRHWAWAKSKRASNGGRWYCRAEKNRRQRERRAQGRWTDPTGDVGSRWDNPHVHRWYNYGYFDRKRGLPGETLTWEQAQPLMLSSCSYCGREMAGGLDRKDCTRAHMLSNVVPCCTTCNFILVDLPYAVKLCLTEGLTKARTAGLLDNWSHARARKFQRSA